MAASAVVTFDANDRRSEWLIVLLVFAVVLAVARITVGLSQFSLFDVLLGPELVAEGYHNDPMQAAIGGLQLLDFLASGLAFLLWLHTAHRNLTALAVRDLKFTPGRAVGGFLVPLVNLVMPVLVLRELWRGSAPQSFPGASTPGSRTKQDAPVTCELVGWWWAAFMVMVLAASVTFVLAIGFRARSSWAGMGHDTSLEAMMGLSFGWLLLSVVSPLTVATSALLSILLVYRITAWQQARMKLAVDRAAPTPGG